ncbi:Periplasmic solute binding protein family protein [compost metagenome]
MPPSAARIAQVAKLAKDNGVKVVLANPSAPHKVLEKFTELSGIPVKTVPSYVQKSGKGSSIEELQNILVDSL